jgi:hypothetical protein
MTSPYKNGYAFHSAKCIQKKACGQVFIWKNKRQARNLLYGLPSCLVGVTGFEPPRPQAWPPDVSSQAESSSKNLPAPRFFIRRSSWKAAVLSEKAWRHTFFQIPSFQAIASPDLMTYKNGYALCKMYTGMWNTKGKPAISCTASRGDRI